MMIDPGRSPPPSPSAVAAAAFKSISLREREARRVQISQNESSQRGSRLYSPHVQALYSFQEESMRGADRKVCIYAGPFVYSRTSLKLPESQGIGSLVLGG